MFMRASMGQQGFDSSVVSGFRKSSQLCLNVGQHGVSKGLQEKAGINGSAKFDRDLYVLTGSRGYTRVLTGFNGFEQSFNGFSVFTRFARRRVRGKRMGLEQKVL